MHLKRPRRHRLRRLPVLGLLQLLQPLLLTRRQLPLLGMLGLPLQLLILPQEQRRSVLLRLHVLLLLLHRLLRLLPLLHRRPLRAAGLLLLHRHLLLLPPHLLPVHLLLSLRLLTVGMERRLPLRRRGREQRPQLQHALQHGACFQLRRPGLLVPSLKRRLAAARCLELGSQARHLRGSSGRAGEGGQQAGHAQDSPASWGGPATKSAPLLRLCRSQPPSTPAHLRPRAAQLLVEAPDHVGGLVHEHDAAGGGRGRVE